MSDILYSEVPSLDLADFTSGNPEKKRAFVKALGDAYQNIGIRGNQKPRLVRRLDKKII